MSLARFGAIATPGENARVVGGYDRLSHFELAPEDCLFFELLEQVGEGRALLGVNGKWEARSMATVDLSYRDAARFCFSDSDQARLFFASWKFGSRRMASCAAWMPSSHFPSWL